MRSVGSVLLVEHVDAVGAVAADARAHVAALRALGADMTCIVLDATGGADLQYAERRQADSTAHEVLRDDAAGRRTLAKRVSARRAAHVLWASAAPGGGAAARCLDAGTRARWWPTGFAPAHAEAGPLEPLAELPAPIAGSTCDRAYAARRRLALWDGPFVLVPARPAAATARATIEALAFATAGRHAADLVVLDHPAPALAALARSAGCGQRVHFVGPAPREAEHAWLGTAALVLLTGDAPLAGGLVLRALVAGAPVLAAGASAAPLAAWLEAHALVWDARAPLGERVLAALDRTPAVLAARERGLEVAAAHDPGALAARLAAALRRDERRAA